MYNVIITSFLLSSLTFPTYMAARLYVVVSFFFSVAITTAAKLQVPDLRVENYTFSSTVKPPGSSKRFFLGGAGVRGLKTNRQFVKFTVIGVYLEKKAFRLLAPKWRHKTVQQLLKTDAFTSDIIRGRFDKFTQVTTILPLTGPQYSEKVAENMVLYWKSIGTYTDAEAKAVAEFLEAFKNQNFPPGSSILFTQSHHGFLTISFSKHGVMPKVGNVVIKNKQLSEGVLESIIAKNGVSPATRQSLAVRLANFLAPPRFY